MMESTKPSSNPTSEIVAYHKVKRKFLNLVDMEKEDPSEILMCEFKGQGFWVNSRIRIAQDIGWKKSSQYLSLNC